MIALPPYAATLGARLERDETGAPLLVLPFGEPVLGRPGFLHGGAIAGLAGIGRGGDPGSSVAGAAAYVARRHGAAQGPRRVRD